MTIIDTSYNKLVTIEHICIACRRTFDQVKAAIEASIPELDPNVVQALTSGDQAVVTAFEQHGPRLFRSFAFSPETTERCFRSLARIVMRSSTRSAIQSRPPG